jgi:ABC-type molybdate transport system ATPase subunit
MTEPLLVVRELDKNFGGVQAVKGLSLEIAAGEVVGLIGPNGSGKSTSVNLISGTMRATRGQILLEGRDISTATIGQRVALGRALLQTPRVLLLDEPLAALDDRLKMQILPYLERVRDETRLPMIYVSHSVTELERLADTQYTLADGELRPL